jgi:hypothetical protein
MLFNVHSHIVMFKILVNCPIDICKHVIGQKIHVKAWNFECKMNFKWIKWSIFLKIDLKNLNFLYWRVSMYFIFTNLIWCGLFFNFNFDITMSCFFESRCKFNVCDNDNIVISKVHYESIFFLEFMHVFRI